MIPGIDVSNNQGVIAWPKVTGVSFAWLKASQGDYFTDAYLQANVRGALAAGIAPGAYHFFEPANGATPQQEVAHLLEVVNGTLAPGMPVAFDWERDPDGRALPKNMGAWADAAVQYFYDHMGFWPVDYTNLDMIQNAGLGTQLQANCGLWLASPGTASPKAPAPWVDLACWQYSWTGRVPGISGNVDMDYFYGTVAQFKLYGAPATPQPVTDWQALYKQSQADLAAAYDRLTRGEAQVTQLGAALDTLMQTLQGVE